MILPRVVVAPSGYKECLLADEGVEAILAGLRRARPEVRATRLPLVGRGEGFAACRPARGTRFAPARAAWAS
ncbi:glycerate kinase [Roseomonas sp. SSH11]|uniref:Glycerate kinase n=1 Tax=Pararoseomonas baculiformis TaxID=2820812 RepID=A0ABS4AJ02_9PROT|nr:glycerate kinase [Pararoseomonas baculiformis]